MPLVQQKFCRKPSTTSRYFPDSPDRLRQRRARPIELPPALTTRISRAEKPATEAIETMFGHGQFHSTGANLLVYFQSLNSIFLPGEELTSGQSQLAVCLSQLRIADQLADRIGDVSNIEWVKIFG